MASCSIREELIAQSPTCMDYTTISYPTVRAMPRQKHNRHFSFNPKSIREDEEREIVHVMKNEEIMVYNYLGCNLFIYPKKNFNRRFRPRGMCIRNNIIYVTSMMTNELLLFTTEGDLITLYNDKTSLTHPRGVVSDGDNNIYVCTTNELVVMNSALPVFQKHVINKAKPKEVLLFREEIFILCWELLGVSINILSLACDLIRTIFLSGIGSLKPWYFDMDNYGNFVIPNQSMHCISVYSNEGKLIVNQTLGPNVRPKGIKLLNHKRSIGISCLSPFRFRIY